VKFQTVTFEESSPSPNHEYDQPFDVDKDLSGQVPSEFIDQHPIAEFQHEPRKEVI
jgi:hypothetical protein